MLPTQYSPTGVYVLPETLGATVIATAEALKAAREQTDPTALLYVEKRGGFQCGTCMYATRANATHGKCQIMQGTIHLTDGCCIAWTPDAEQLHLYRAPAA